MASSLLAMASNLIAMRSGVLSYFEIAIDLDFTRFNKEWLILDWTIVFTRPLWAGLT